MDEKPRILPLVWLLIALVLMAALDYRMPFAVLLHAPWNRLGLAPGALGIWMMLASAHAFRKAETGLVPFEAATTLVTSGFFRYTRNPMYLGMVLLLLGAAMVMGTAGALLPVPLFVLVIQRQFILAEERFMEAAFGDEYLAYRGRVRRWL